jgi:hypothetical protein
MKETGPSDFEEWRHQPEGLGQGRGDGNSMNEPDWQESEIHEPVLPPEVVADIPFDITRFAADVPLAVERGQITGAKNQTIHKALDEHIPFTDFDIERTSLQLEHWKPSGEVAHITVDLDEGGTVRVRFEEADDTLEPVEHHYYQRSDAQSGESKVYRQDFDADAYTGDLPKEGEVPRELFMQLSGERYRQLQDEHQELEQLGLGPQEVGLAEMQYVQKLVEGAEPARISVRRLFGIMESRLNSPLQPNREDAVDASYAFKTYVHRFITQRAADSKHPTVTEELIDPQNVQEMMRVYAAERPDERGWMVPFVEVMHTEFLPLDAPSTWPLPAAAATVRRIFTYQIEQDQLMGHFKVQVTGEDGSVIAQTEQSTTADETEASAVRNFLYNPLFRREE